MPVNSQLVKDALDRTRAEDNQDSRLPTEVIDPSTKSLTENQAVHRLPTETIVHQEDQAGQAAYKGPVGVVEAAEPSDALAAVSNPTQAKTVPPSQVVDQPQPIEAAPEHRPLVILAGEDTQPPARVEAQVQTPPVESNPETSTPTQIENAHQATVETADQTPAKTIANQPELTVVPPPVAEAPGATASATTEASTNHTRADADPNSIDDALGLPDRTFNDRQQAIKAALELKPAA